MSANPLPSDLSNDFEQRIEDLELEWQAGATANIVGYVVGSEGTDIYFSNLIQVDLEYRWKRFQTFGDKTSIDEHGFPDFPLLDDYVRYIPEDAKGILTPEMLAEEYRVRTKWGDQPCREDFRTRLPDRQTEIDVAINQVETELKTEGAASTLESSQSATSQTTVSHPNDGRSPGSARNSVVPRQLGRYLLDSPIGRGGFGEVWRAFDPELRRHVAIKIPRPDRVFSPDSISDFKKEGRRLAQVGPMSGIVTVFDTGECSGHAYLVSELIEGGSLATHLKTASLSSIEAARLVAAVAAALHQAHLQGLVHRDIKPGNILLKRDGTPIVADLGLAVNEREQLSEGPGTVGTVAYMPPEQIRGDSNLATPQADTYSLGVTFYEALTGRLPFVADTIAEYEHQILHRPPRPPRTINESIPQQLEKICLKCLAKSASDRYTTAGDLATALRRWERGSVNRQWTTAQVLGLVASLFGILCLTVAARAWVKHNHVDVEPIDAVKVDVEAIDALTTRPEPTEIRWPGHSPEVGTWFVDHQQALRPLIVSSQPPRLIQLGEIEKSAAITIDIQKTDWNGMSGIFLGYRENVWEGRLCAEFQLIQIVRTTRNGKPLFFVDRAKTRIIPETGKMYPLYSKLSQPVVIDGTTTRIEIDLDRDQIKRIRLDGTDLPTLFAPEVNAQFDVSEISGRWGVFNTLGTAWFINPESQHEGEVEGPSRANFSD